jgi:protein O-mannosyl-transferase
MIRAFRALTNPSSRTRWWLLALLLVALVAASSANGLRNGFTYDDVYIVQKNGIVHTLDHWWRLFKFSYWPRLYGSDGYRPITMLSFAVEWVVGHGAPWVFHATNVVLYAATTVAVFWVASMLLPLWAAWLAAALFAVHPVHVEAVANVVGQAELSVALLLIVAVGIYLRQRLKSGERRLSLPVAIAIAGCYAVALFAKEHAIVLPALLVGIEMTVVHDDRSLRQRLVALRPMLLVLTLIAVAYLGARDVVKGGDISGFQPFIVFQALDLSYVNRVLTMIGVVPEWVRLFLWPAHLSTEYAPPYVDIAQGPSLVQLPGLLLLVGIIGLGVVLMRRRGLASTASFGIVWLCITLLPVSNFVVPAGIIIAERTLFLPSVGVMFAIGALAAWIATEISAMRSKDAMRITRLAAGAACIAILVAGCWRSTTRTSVWHDNERLFTQAVIDAPQSYRAYYMLGAWKFETGNKIEGERSYRHALKLFPYDPFMAYNLAQQYQTSGMFKAAIPLYRWALEIAPRFREGEGRENLAICYLYTDDPVHAREQALTGMGLGGARLKDMRRIVQLADSSLGRGAYRKARTKQPLPRAESTLRNLPAQSQITASRIAAR